MFSLLPRVIVAMTEKEEEEEEREEEEEKTADERGVYNYLLGICFRGKRREKEAIKCHEEVFKLKVRFFSF